MSDWIAILISWLPLLFSGGIITAVITYFANRLSAKRQNDIEIKKQRMKILSKYASLYNRLALYTTWNISQKIRNSKNGKDIDYPLVMYYVCDFLQLRKQMICSLGTLQFENQEAETIINNFERAIIDIIKKEFNEIEFSILSCLVDENNPYHKFYDKINENEKELFEKFKKFVENYKDSLEANCRYYSELIMLEFSHIYTIWYKQEPGFSKLSDKLRKKLKEDYPDYYKRISKF